jgi:hypothetical protein
LCDGTHSLIDFLLVGQSFQQLSGRNPACPQASSRSDWLTQERFSLLIWRNFLQPDIGLGATSELPVMLEELKKSLLPGDFSTNRGLIGQ